MHNKNTGIKKIIKIHIKLSLKVKNYHLIDEFN